MLLDDIMMTFPGLVPSHACVCFVLLGLLSQGLVPEILDATFSICHPQKNSLMVLFLGSEIL